MVSDVNGSHVFCLARDASFCGRIKQVDGNYVACRKASPCCEYPSCIKSSIWGCRAFKACQLWKRFRLPWDAIAEPGLQCDVLGSLMWRDSVSEIWKEVMQQWFGRSFAVHLRTVFQTSRCGMKAREERQVFICTFSTVFLIFLVHSAAISVLLTWLLAEHAGVAFFSRSSKL